MSFKLKDPVNILDPFFILDHLSQIIHKPGSVLADHLSSLNVAIKIKRINCEKC